MSKHPRCELISWAKVHRLCRKLAENIRNSGFAPDLIVAIGRGGYVPARVLADLLGLMDLVSIRVEHYLGARKGDRARIRQPLNVEVSDRRILLLDDISDTGDTFDAALAHIAAQGKPAQLHTAVIHHKIMSRVEPDYYAHRIVLWRWIIYPWAVTEDLCAFTRELDPIPGSREELGRRLEREWGIRVGPHTLDDVMVLLQPPK